MCDTSVDTNVIKDLVVVGAGGLGREIAWLIKEINQSKRQWNFLGFIDDGVTGITVEGLPILGSIEDLINKSAKPWFVVAIADSQIRKRIVERLVKQGFPQATLLHPSVNVSAENKIGCGSIICSKTILTTNVHIGESCILNLGCFVGHDTMLKDYVSLMPCTNLAGEVVIGEGCYLGLSVCVVNRCNVGDWSVIGAGAVVVNDMPANTVAVGVPAKVIKTK